MEFGDENESNESSSMESRSKNLSGPVTWQVSEAST